MSKQKDKLILLTLLLFPLYCLAETCPTITNIQQHHFNGWQAYDSETRTPLAAKAVSQFEKQVERFALAEWENNSPKTDIIHCYYRDKNGSTLDAYLAKSHFTPDNSHNRWYSVSGAWQCAADNTLCTFKRNKSTLAAETESTQSGVFSRFTTFAKTLFDQFS